MQAALDVMKAEHKAEIDTLRADYKAEAEGMKAQFQREISDLEARLKAAEPGRQPAPDRSPDSAAQPAQSDALKPGEPGGVLSASEKADAADLAEATVGSGRNENLALEKPKRPGLSEESMQAVKAGLGLADSLGFLPPGLSLVMGGDAAREAVKDMPPEDHYHAMELAHNALAAFGSYPPDMAVAGIMTCMVVPAVRAGFRDIVHKIMRKD
jgi:hypothetical protein